MSPPNIQFIGSSGLVDWDTYEDGIWLVTDFNATSTDNAKSQVSVVTSSSFTTPSASSAGFYNAAIRSRYHSDATTATLPEYLAIWDVSASQWYVKQRDRTFGSAGAYIVNYGTNLYGGTFTPVDGQDYYFVFLTQDPGDITGWRDFDTYTWDTYKDGIYRQYWTNVGSKPFNNVWYTEVEIETPVSFSPMSVGSTYIKANSTTSVRVDNPNGNLPIYMLLWNTINKTWHKCVRSASYLGGTQNDYSVTPAMPDPSTEPWEVYYLVWSTQDPGDITHFADYNKPIPWETDANGIWRVNTITYGSSDIIELEASTNGSGTGGVDWEFSYMGSTENCTGNGYSYRYSTAYGNQIGYPTGSVDSATLVTYSLRDRQFTSASAGFCVTSRFYDSNLSPRDYTTANDGQVFILYDRLFEPEELYRLSTYDGPVANWDTYANGVYLLGYLSLQASEYGLTEVPAYAGTTYNSTFGNRLAVRTNIGVETNYNTPASNADSPPYIAVYIHEYHDTQDGYASNAKGWYVFERPPIPAVNASLTYTPYAWPGDTSTGNYASDNSNGYLNNGGDDSSGYIVVLLDEYNDPVGAGGTDHWTKPPYVVYSPNAAPYATTAVQHGSGTLTANRYTNFDLYGWGALRASSPNYGTAVIVCSGAYDANVNVEVYRDNALYADGVGDFSSTGTKFVSLTYREPNIQKVPGYDFANGEDMWFVVYHND